MRKVDGQIQEFKHLLYCCSMFNYRNFAAVPQRLIKREKTYKQREKQLSGLDWAKIHNAEISRTNSFKKLYILIDEQGRRFDHINIATAFVQVARLQNGENPEEVEQLLLLLARDFTKKMVGKMTTWSLSNCLWAFVKTGFDQHEVGIKAVKFVLEEITEKISSLKGADLANILWALSQMGMRDVKFLDNMSTLTIIQAEFLEPRALSGLALSFAKLNYYTFELFHVLQENCVKKMNNFNGQMIGNSVCAMSHIRHKNDMFLIRVCEKLQDLDSGRLHMDVRCMDQVVRGFTIFNFAHDETIRRLRDHLLNDLQLDFLAMANLFYALALLGFELEDAEPVLVRIRSGFEKMGIISFNEVTQFQIFCATLLFAARGMIVSLPPQLLEPSREIYVRSVKNQPLLQEMAIRQNHVARILSGLSFKPIESFIAGEYVVIDIAMKIKGENVAMFVNGAECYTMSSPPERLGSLIARYLVAIGQGFKVVEIPYFEWDVLKDDEDRKVYLQHRLQTQVELEA